MRKWALAIPILLFVIVISCGEEGRGYFFEAADLDEVVESGLEDSLYAGAVLLVGDSDGILYQHASGNAEQFDFNGFEIESPVVMTNDHLFDLASLTKVLSTTLGMMVLHDRHQISIDDPVHKYLPEFDTAEKQSITIGHLLSHTSGLVQWFPGYYVANSPEERLNLTVEAPLFSVPGETRSYSDFGFMVLGDVIERVSGQSLDQFLTENIYGPMDLQSTVFNPDDSQFSQIVATSHGNPFEKKMVYDDDFGYTVDVDPESWNGWRDYTLKGEVNDGNAFYTQKGGAGHAGLFSTAEDVYRLLKVFVNQGKNGDEKLFSSETIDLFTTEDSYGHGLGWMMSEASLQGKGLPEGSFGHTGFTGTNVIVSPGGRIMVLLTNRQHVGVDDSGQYPNLRDIRERLSKVVFQ